MATNYGYFTYSAKREGIFKYHTFTSSTNDLISIVVIQDKNLNAMFTYAHVEGLDDGGYNSECFAQMGYKSMLALDALMKQLIEHVFDNCKKYGKEGAQIIALAYLIDEHMCYRYK